MAFISRIGQKKQNYQITLAILQMGANVDHDSELQVIWKRGKEQTDKTQLYEVNEIEVDVETKESFQRVSTFYTNNGNVMPKGCDLQIMLHQNKKEKMIGFVLNHDMSPFVGKQNQKERINIVNSEIPETFIQVEWSIMTTNIKKEDHAKLNNSMGTRGTVTTRGTGGSRGTMLDESVSKLQDLNLSTTEIRDAIDEKEKIKKDIQSLKTNLDIVLATKQDAEKKYNEEKKLRILIEQQYKDVKDDEAHQPELPTELTEKLAGLKETNDLLRGEIQTYENEIKQKQKLAENLEEEASSLQKMITEARKCGANSNQEQVLKAKDDEIEELKRQLIQAKADQEAQVQKNQQQIEVIKQQMVEVEEQFEEDEEEVEEREVEDFESYAM